MSSRILSKNLEKNQIIARAQGLVCISRWVWVRTWTNNHRCSLILALAAGRAKDSNQESRTLADSCTTSVNNSVRMWLRQLRAQTEARFAYRTGLIFPFACLFILIQVRSLFSIVITKGRDAEHLFRFCIRAWVSSPPIFYIRLPKIFPRD